MVTLVHPKKHHYFVWISPDISAGTDFKFRSKVLSTDLCPKIVPLTTYDISALSLFGATESSFVKGTNAFFLDRSAESTLPYGIDDPNLKGRASKTNFLDLQELIVDLYNGAKSANAVKG